MAVMQKFRDRFRRSSSSDVTSICIPSLPSESLKAFDVDVRRLSLTSTATAQQNFDKFGKLVGNLPVTEPLGAIKTKDPGTTEKMKFDFLEKYEKQKTEIKALEEKLKDSLEKITQRDETIAKLHAIIDQTKQERLQDEEVRYQRSILAKRQHTIDLENELDKMKSQIQKTNSVAEKRVQKAKEHISKVKQDCALKIFEIKQENSRLVEELATVTAKLSSIKIEESSKGSRGTVNNEHSNEGFIPEKQQDRKQELILQLSEQISILDDENRSLKEELRKIKKKVSKQCS